MNKTQKRSISILLAFIVIFIIIAITFFISFSRGGTSLATGLYTFQTQINSEDSWQIEYTKALTSGSFRKNIPADYLEEKILHIESGSESGTLTLIVSQDGLEETINLSNAVSIDYPLENFDPGKIITLIFSHSRSTNVWLHVNYR